MRSVTQDLKALTGAFYRCDKDKKFSGLLIYSYLKDGAFTAFKRGACEKSTFVNKRCTKGVVPYLSKIVHNMVRGKTSLRSLPLLEVM